MIYIIGVYFIITFLYSIIAHNNTYNSFLKGVKDGLKIIINMFSILLTFSIVVKCINNCGILVYLNKIFNNSGLLNILMQCMVRPLSNGSSYAIMIDIFNIYGVNSFYGILSSFIHSSCDTLFYIVTLYYSYSKYKCSSKGLLYGLIVVIFTYILCFIVAIIFFE